MNRLAAVAAALVTVGCGASAFAALGDFEVFYPTRDTLMGWYDPGTGASNRYGNNGWKQCARLSKWNYQENYICDFDKPAIQAWLAAHPLDAGQEYDVKFRFVTAGGWKDPYEEGLWRIEFTTLNMPAGVDWVEGNSYADGCHAGPDWNLTPGVPGATCAYASQVWRSVDYVPTIDVANSVQWTLLNGTPVAWYMNEPGLHRYINSEALIYDWNDPNIVGVGDEMFITLDFDPAHPQGVHPMPLFNDFVYDPENKGLTFGLIRKWDQATQSWIQGDENFALYTENAKDPPQSNPAQRPYVRIEIIQSAPPRIPGDVHAQGDPGYGCVDGADYTVWADNYNTTGNRTCSNGGWSVGNFTEDDAVDGADYTVWADHYLQGCGGRAVPEPGGALALILGAWWRLRAQKPVRGRRPT